VKRTCTVTGLVPGSSYSFQLVAFSGTLGVNAVFGGLSNVATGASQVATVPGVVGTVKNLAVAGSTDSSITLSFTEVTNGSGKAASYDMRSTGGTSLTWWLANGSLNSKGTCVSPMAGTTIGTSRTCVVKGLVPGTTYSFQLVAFTGTLGVNAVFGGLSNVSTGTTKGAVGASTSGDPLPSPGATILRDTRRGGAHDLQAAGMTTLMQADALLGTAKMADAYSAWDFTTNVDGRGLHAYVVKWSGVGANCPIDAQATRMIYFPTAPKHVFYQWKQWMGRTATGGGIGTVGDFTVNNPNCNNSGRKMWLAYRSPDTPDGRVDYIWHPAGPDIESWYGIAPNPGTIFQNLGRDFNPEQAIGQVNTYTLEYQAESAPGASDGLVRLWVNGVKRMEYLRQATGTQGFAESEFPTIFRAPLRDQTEYFWDVVVWTP
jgi:hypothetical protein